MVTAPRLSIISCGSLHADRTSLLLKKGVTIRSRHDHEHFPSPWGAFATYCVLVETEAGSLIWDTGCPRDWEQRWGPSGLNDYYPYDDVTEEQYLDSQLRRMGVEPGSVDIVALSHLHFDHIGNTRMFQDAGSRVVCSRDEIEFANSFIGPFLGGHVKAEYEGLDLEPLVGDVEILPGVTLLQMPGHTPGSMSLQVDLPDSGTMVFTSDAVYLGESFGPPAVPPAIVSDLRGWYASVEKLRAIQRQRDALIVFGHDAEQIASLRLAPDHYYT
ncbi:N-acyl homoserine lactonase family protein [Dactylosporangium sp. CA-092794]|uniref:N-acyl homoserine lactonase family protein n=1 Tax=Dactylosporangium sp. CA-092794 TaxID=3239929 RepID=UPI003D93B015